MPYTKYIKWMDESEEIGNVNEDVEDEISANTSTATSTNMSVDFLRALLFELDEKETPHNLEGFQFYKKLLENLYQMREQE
jgi:hypothetical protein